MSYPVPKNEQARLDALRQYDIMDTGTEQCFDDLTQLAATICGTPTSLMTLLDQERQWFKSKVGMEACETKRDVAFCSHTIVNKDKLTIVNDATSDERFRDNTLVTKSPHIRFYAGAPLVTPEGHALGSLCVIDYEARQLSDSQKDALRRLARQVVAQLELRRTSRQLAESLRTVHELRTLVPVCSYCKSVRDDDGYWRKLEHYIRDHQNADVSHGICPACEEKIHREL